MLHFVLCDDNIHLLDRLANSLEGIFLKNDILAEISFKSPNADEVIQYVDSNSVDVLMLDINLKSSVSGCDIADIVRKKNKDVYIIDPNGIKWYKEHSKDSNLRVIVIGLTLPLEERRRRCSNRSDFYSDFEDRVKAEQPSFDEFKKSGDFNYLITNWDSEHTADMIKKIINYELKYGPRRL